MRAAAAGLVLFIGTWAVVENVGLTRFLPAPESDLSSVFQVGDWPTEGGSPQRASVAPGATTQLRGEVAWEVDIGVAGGGAVVTGDTLYVGTTDGMMHALSASDGTSIWKQHLGAPTSSTPSVAGHLVYVGMLDGRLTALDREDGSVVWTFRTDAPVRSSPAVVDGVLFAGSSDRRLYALDALTGEQRWSFATGGRITSSPAVNEDLVVVVSQDNLIHFIDRRTAKRWFDYEVSLTNGSAVIADDSIYAADARGTIRRVRWNNRAWPFEKSLRNIRQWMFRWGMASELPPQKGVVWVRQEAGESFIGTPAVDPERVYASAASGEVFAYDRQTGDAVWQADLGAPGATSPTIRGDELIVGTRMGALVALEVATGKERWRIGGGSGVAHDIAVGGGAVYVLEADGTLIGIR